jgi:peptidyl-prolyl cis-trans isomerase C
MKWKIFREPLVAFVLVGGLIFLVNGIFAKPEDDRIQVTQETVAGLIETRGELIGRPLTETERQELIENFITNEILLREAVARGLHLQDSRVRDRLVKKMYFLIDEEPPEPTDADLHTLYEQRKEHYLLPPSVSFEHLFFNEGRQAAAAILPSLRSGVKPPDNAGDIFWLGRKMAYYTADQLISVLGVQFVNEIRELPLGKWSGPIRSARGWHLVRLEARHPAEPLPAAELDRRIRADWVEQWKLDRRAVLVAQLRERYQVDLSPANKKDRSNATNYKRYADGHLPVTGGRLGT